MSKNVLVGCVVFGYNATELKVLLKGELSLSSVSYSLPAGSIGMNESGDSVVKEVLRSCLQEANIYTAQYRCFSFCDEGRDTVCVVYVALINTEIVYFNDLVARWFSVSALPSLAKWEQDIIAGARVWLKEQLAALPIGYRLLPKRFTLLQLRSLLELILQRRFDHANFSKKINSLNFIKRSKKRCFIVGNRPSYLYSIDWKRLQQTNHRFTFQVRPQQGIP